MRIQTLHIENFKSIKTLDLELDNLTAIIGPNGSGKTNILQAIDYVIGEGWTTKAKINRELFNDPTIPLTIQVTLSSPVIIPDKYGNKEIESVEVELNLSSLTAKSTYNNGKPFWGQDQFKRSCHYLYLPADRQLADELRVSAWTMLGKLMNQVYESYVEYKQGKDVLTKEFKNKIQMAKEYLEEDFPTTEGKFSFHKFVEVFTKHCKENSGGFANSFIPELEIYNMNMFYKTLQIHVKEELFDNHFNSEQVGAGMQNLLVISIFQTYAELMGGRVILGIEEPELYLYPQAQRALYKKFIEISKKTQILYTTHSPSFVSASRPNDIQLVRTSRDKGTYLLKKDEYFNADNANEEKFSIYTNFSAVRNELFFSKKALLVEGAADKILFETLCETKWKIDLDRLGYSIIDCGGKSGVNYFIGICKLIGFEDYFAVWDSDDKDYKPKNKNWLPESLENEKGIEITGNIEKYLKLPCSDDHKIENANTWAINIDVDKIPELLMKANEFLTDRKPTTMTNTEVVTSAEGLPF